jgi:hypothetical protein
VSKIAAFLQGQGIRRAWVLDSEYTPVEAGVQIPICVCALDLITLERRDIWTWGENGVACPFEMASDELFIMWAADADILTFIAMGWPTPLKVLDPRIAWMRIDNGGDQYKPNSFEKKGYSLLDAARLFGVPAIPEAQKKYWQGIAKDGGPFTPDNRVGLIRYCRSDVDLTTRVLMKLWEPAELFDKRTFVQALIFGRYQAAVARCYVTAIPLDMPNVKRLIKYAGAASLGLIRANADKFPIFRADGSLSHKMLADFLEAHGQLKRWRRTPTGRLAISEDVFEEMAEAWPLAAELHRFRNLIDQLRSFDLSIGADGRNRVSLRSFGQISSRNNTAKGGGFIYARHSVFRHLIQAPEGRALVAVDWSAQELHIAARLSRDPVLIQIVEAHLRDGRDPYIELAIAVGLIPADAGDNARKSARPLGKIIQLALLYGAGPGLIAGATGMSMDQARAFLRRQREVFNVFFAWSDRKARMAVSGKELSTILGWTIRFTPETSVKSPERTGRNICVQGSAADMMRILMIRLTEAGYDVCAAIHDGFLIECGIDEAEAVRSAILAIMDQCAIDLVGSPIPIKSQIFRHPENYQEEDDDAKGVTELFEHIMRLVEEAEESVKPVRKKA